MTRWLRWIPATIVGSFLLLVAIWTMAQPVEDMKASLIGFMLVSIGCMALVPCLHFAIDAPPAPLRRTRNRLERELDAWEAEHPDNRGRF